MRSSGRMVNALRRQSGRANLPHTSSQQILISPINRLQTVGPPLHHFRAARQILGSVICPPDCVTLTVRRLDFDAVAILPMFVQDGGKQSPEALRCLLAVEAHAVERKQHAILGHGASRRPDRARRRYPAWRSREVPARRIATQQNSPPSTMCAACPGSYIAIPRASPRWVHPQIESTAVRDSMRLIGRLCPPACHIRQLHPGSLPILCRAITTFLPPVTTASQNAFGTAWDTWLPIGNTSH